MLISRDVIIQLRWDFHQKMRNFPVVCNVKILLILVQKIGSFTQKKYGFPCIKSEKRERRSSESSNLTGVETCSYGKVDMIPGFQ